MTGNGEVTVAETDAMNIFNGNISQRSTNNLLQLEYRATSRRDEDRREPDVDRQFQRHVPVTFMKVVGYSTR